MPVLRSLRSFDLIFLAYLFSVTFLVVHVREGLPEWTSLVVRNLLVFFSWILIVSLGEFRRKGLLLFLRNWYFCAGIPIVFTELKFLIHLVRPQDLDPILMEIDYLVFGCHPSVWMEKIIHPRLTAFLQACYLLYFPLPLPLGAYLYAKDREAFGPLVTTLGMGYFVAFVGYLVFPAIGPRFELASMYKVQLSGTALTNAVIQHMTVAEGVCRDCFPSGHVALVVIVLVYAYRKCRALLPLYVVIGSGIIMATVYLRYHYVIDVPAGVLLGMFSLKAGPWFDRWWEEWASRSLSPKRSLILTESPDSPPCE